MARSHRSAHLQKNKLMKRDPIVEEVRKVRDAYAKKFNYDLDAICRDLQEKQRLSKKVISLPPKRPNKRWRDG